MPSASARLGRWLKPAGTIALYVFVFYWTDARAILGRLRAVELSPLVAGILIYAAGQAVSTFKWRLLIAPLELAVSYTRLLGFYFTGMFFNLFLPTIVGGDAVKAVLLARETHAPARATMSVFMERNTGLCALLLIAMGASLVAPPVRLFGLPLAALTALLAAGYAVVNVVLLSPWAYHLADRIIAASPLVQMRPRARSLYDAITPVQARGADARRGASALSRLSSVRDRRGILERARLVTCSTSLRRRGVRAAGLAGRHGPGQR